MSVPTSDASGFYISDTFGNFLDEVTKLPIKMGSMTAPQGAYLMDFLRAHPEIKQVLETGFHVGIGTGFMLDARSDISVTSFDIFWFDYTRKAKLFLDIAYPGRNTLIAGNSVNTLPTFFTQVPFMPDFVFIDGGHERPVPYIDLYYILNHVKPETPIMIDDYCLEHGQHGVIEAVNRFIELGILSEVQVYKAEDRGWIFGKRSALPMPPCDLSSESIAKVLRDTESHYSASQGDQDAAADYVLNVPQVQKAKEVTEVQSKIDFTFGIVTGGNADEYIQKIVDSIREQAIPNYEIIIIGKTNIKGGDLLVIPFDETIRVGWFTKKKNIIAKIAKYDNIVLLHDYVKFAKGWYEGFLKFGNTFKICVNKIVTIDGRRYRDHAIFKRFVPQLNPLLPYECEFLPQINPLLPYECELTPAVSKLTYISGLYYVIKKTIALEYPLDERLAMSQGEDVIFSHTLSKNNILMECNPFSTVSLLKEKYSHMTWEKEMTLEFYSKFSKWAEIHGEKVFQKQCQHVHDWLLKDCGIVLL